MFTVDLSYLQSFGLFLTTGPEYRFFFADERAATGDPVYGGISGAAAAEFYLTLAEEGAEIPWYASFVSGKGFVDFAESRRL